MSFRYSNTLPGSKPNYAPQKNLSPHFASPRSETHHAVHVNQNQGPNLDEDPGDSSSHLKTGNYDHRADRPYSPMHRDRGGGYDENYDGSRQSGRNDFHYSPDNAEYEPSPKQVQFNFNNNQYITESPDRSPNATQQYTHDHDISFQNSSSIRHDDDGLDPSRFAEMFDYSDVEIAGVEYDDPQQMHPHHRRSPQRIDTEGFTTPSPPLQHEVFDHRGDTRYPRQSTQSDRDYDDDGGDDDGDDSDDDDDQASNHAIDRGRHEDSTGEHRYPASGHRLPLGTRGISDASTTPLQRNISSTHRGSYLLPTNTSYSPTAPDPSRTNSPSYTAMVGRQTSPPTRDYQHSTAVLERINRRRLVRQERDRDIQLSKPRPHQDPTEVGWEPSIPAFSGSTQAYTPRTRRILDYQDSQVFSQYLSGLQTGDNDEQLDRHQQRRHITSSNSSRVQVPSRLYPDHDDADFRSRTSSSSLSLQSQSHSTQASPHHYSDDVDQHSYQPMPTPNPAANTVMKRRSLTGLRPPTPLVPIVSSTLLKIEGIQASMTRTQPPGDEQGQNPARRRTGPDHSLETTRASRTPTLASLEQTRGTDPTYPTRPQPRPSTKQASLPTYYDRAMPSHDDQHQHHTRDARKSPWVNEGRQRQQQDYQSRQYHPQNPDDHHNNIYTSSVRRSTPQFGSQPYVRRTEPSYDSRPSGSSTSTPHEGRVQTQTCNNRQHPSYQHTSPHYLSNQPSSDRDSQTAMDARRPLNSGTQHRRTVPVDAFYDGDHDDEDVGYHRRQRRHRDSLSPPSPRQQQMHTSSRTRTRSRSRTPSRSYPESDRYNSPSPPASPQSSSRNARSSHEMHRQSTQQQQQHTQTQNRSKQLSSKSPSKIRHGHIQTPTRRQIKSTGTKSPAPIRSQPSAAKSNQNPGEEVTRGDGDRAKQSQTTTATKMQTSPSSPTTHAATSSEPRHQQQQQQQQHPVHNPPSQEKTSNNSPSTHKSNQPIGDGVDTAVMEKFIQVLERVGQSFMAQQVTKQSRGASSGASQQVSSPQPPPQQPLQPHPNPASIGAQATRPSAFLSPRQSRPQAQGPSQQSTTSAPPSQPPQQQHPPHPQQFMNYSSQIHYPRGFHPPAATTKSPYYRGQTMMSPGIPPQANSHTQPTPSYAHLVPDQTSQRPPSTSAGDFKLDSAAEPSTGHSHPHHHHQPQYYQQEQQGSANQPQPPYAYPQSTHAQSQYPSNIGPTAQPVYQQMHHTPTEYPPQHTSGQPSVATSSQPVNVPFEMYPQPQPQSQPQHTSMGNQYTAHHPPSSIHTIPLQRTPGLVPTPHPQQWHNNAMPSSAGPHSHIPSTAHQPNPHHNHSLQNPRFVSTSDQPTRQAVNAPTIVREYPAFPQPPLPPGQGPGSLIHQQHQAQHQAHHQQQRSPSRTEPTAKDIRPSPTLPREHPQQSSKRDEKIPDKLVVTVLKQLSPMNILADEHAFRYLDYLLLHNTSPPYNPHSGSAASGSGKQPLAGHSTVLSTHVTQPKAHMSTSAANNAGEHAANAAGSLYTAKANPPQFSSSSSMPEPHTASESHAQVDDKHRHHLDESKDPPIITTPLPHITIKTIYDQNLTQIIRYFTLDANSPLDEGLVRLWLNGWESSLKDQHSPCECHFPLQRIIRVGSIGGKIVIQLTIDAQQVIDSIPGQEPAQQDVPSDNPQRQRSIRAICTADDHNHLAIRSASYYADKIYYILNKQLKSTVAADYPSSAPAVRPRINKVDVVQRLPEIFRIYPLK